MIDSVVSKINLIQSGIPYLNYNGVAVYNDDIRENSFNIIRYLSFDSVDISSRDVSDVGNFKNETFYFVYPFTSGSLLGLFKSILQHDCGFSKSLIKILKSDNVKTTFIDVHEVHNPDVVMEIINEFKNLNINLPNIFWINNDFNLDFYKKKYNWKINIGKTNHLIYNTCKGMLSVETTFVKDKMGPFFLCKNKMPKPHRVGILSYLDKNKILEDVNFSLLNPGAYTHYRSVLYKSIIEDPSDMSIVRKYLKSKPLHTISEINRTDFHDDTIFTNFAGEIEYNDYSQSYINITTESVFFEDNIHLSEKSFKPFVFYQLPIIVASPNHVKVLRDYYKLDLFDDLIDHSYDNEPNNSKRFKMITYEIKRLFLDKENVKKYYIENKHRLEYNRKRIEELTKSKIDLSVFNSIIQKTI